MISRMQHDLPPPVHGALGDFDRDWSPHGRRIGRSVAIETLTHHAGDAPDLLMDPRIADVFASVTTAARPDLLTGPIASRVPSPGTCCRSTSCRHAAATLRVESGRHWGHLYDELPTERGDGLRTRRRRALGRALFGSTGRNAVARSTGHHRRTNAAAARNLRARVVVPLRPHFGTMGVAACRSRAGVVGATRDHGGQRGQLADRCGGACSTLCRCPARCCRWRPARLAGRRRDQRDRAGVVTERIAALDIRP